MTARVLVPYPGASEPPGIAVTAAAELVGPAVLELEFRLEGDLDLVRVPPLAAGARADRLWEKTCFEAFVAEAVGERYIELNFSPSTDWAAYSFDGYRRGMRPVELAQVPLVRVDREPRALVVTVRVDLAAQCGAGWPWRIGLTAVVAAVTGKMSHWALAHPADKPDFHDAAGWTVTLEGKAS
jgi:hypothetical protein